MKQILYDTENRYRYQYGSQPGISMAVSVDHYAVFPDVGGHRNMEVITPSYDVSPLFGPGPPPP